MKLSPLGAGFSPATASATAAARPCRDDRERHPQEPATIRNGFTVDETAGLCGRRPSAPVRYSHAELLRRHLLYAQAPTCGLSGKPHCSTTSNIFLKRCDAANA